MADTTNHEQRLMQAIDSYLASVEAGQPISRELLMAEYSDVAEELDQCLGSLDFLNRVSSDSKSQSLATPPGLTAADGPNQDFKSSPVTDPLLNAQLGEYRILRQLGRGGMGVVYEGEQHALQRKVAIKVLPFVATLDERQLHRFRLEAISAASLNHNHIVPVYSVGYENGTHFYVMPLVEGESLSQLTKRQVDDPSAKCVANDSTQSLALALTADNSTPVARFRRIAELFAPIADALEHAHQAGIVHRDVKPSNLLLDRSSKLWLTDFGLAMREDSLGLTATGDVVGTLRYMSPEQLLGNRSTVDHRSDVYSLGLAIYELATGKAAFEASHKAALVRQISENTPPLMRKIDRQIPAELEVLVQKAISRYPEDRYQTAQAMAEDLRRFAEDVPVLARRPSVTQRVARWTSRHRRVMSAAVLLGILVCAGLVVGNILLAKEQKRTQQALDSSLDLLTEYHTTMRSLSSVVSQRQLVHEPAFASMIKDFSAITEGRLQRLRTIAHENSDVRWSLMQQLFQLASASWFAGDKDNARQLFTKLSWLANRDVAVAAKAAEVRPNKPEHVLRLAKSWQMLAVSEFYSTDVQGDGQEYVESAIALLKRAAERQPAHTDYQKILGRLLCDKARLYQQSDQTQCVLVLEEACEILGRAVKGDGDFEAQKFYSYSLKRLASEYRSAKRFADAVKTSGQLSLLLNSQLKEDFSPVLSHAYCDALFFQLQMLGRSRLWPDASRVSGFYLKAAREGVAKSGTDDFRRHLIRACHWTIHANISGGKKIDPGPLMREARRASFIGGARNSIFDLAISGIRSANNNATDKSMDPELRRQAFEESFQTFLQSMDMRDDLDFTLDDSVQQIQDMRSGKTFVENLAAIEAEIQEAAATEPALNSKSPP